jgi:hypothetical protein
VSGTASGAVTESADAAPRGPGQADRRDRGFANGKAGTRDPAFSSRWQKTSAAKGGTPRDIVTKKPGRRAQGNSSAPALVFLPVGDTTAGIKVSSVELALSK